MSIIDYDSMHRVKIGESEIVANHFGFLVKFKRHSRFKSEFVVSQGEDCELFTISGDFPGDFPVVMVVESFLYSQGHQMHLMNMEPENA